MGYTTDFYGHVTVDPPLNEAEVSYLVQFSGSRRMDRDNGPLFVKGGGFHGQEHTDDIRDYNRPPEDQPGLWCQWVPAVDDWPTDEAPADQIVWDGGEKFYYAGEWMAYIVDCLLSPKAKTYILEHLNEDERLKDFTCDHVVNGVIEAQGEERDDMWSLRVTDNVVTTHSGRVVYE